MDFDPVLKWRLGLRRRCGLPLDSCEFLEHGGSYFLVEWRAHPQDLEVVQVLKPLVVEHRFRPVAVRMMKIVETYYNELALPSPHVHAANVKAAMTLATACLRPCCQWFDGCTAPAQTLNEIFEIVRDAVGGLATSLEPVSAVRLEAVVHSTLIAMNQRRLQGGCIPQRIFA